MVTCRCANVYGGDSERCIRGKLLRQYRLCQHRSQKPPRVTGGATGNVFRCTRRHDSPAAGASFWTQVDDPIGRLDYAQVVLDHEHRVVLIHQPVQHAEQPANIVAVQARRRLIEDVQRMANAAAAEFSRQFDPLRLAA